MHRIASPGATAANLFTVGDPQTGVPATEVDDLWLNAVQEEIAGVVLASGAVLLTPSNDTRDQLLAALRNKTTGLNADLVRDLPADFSSTLQIPGSQALPSGLRLQWGVVTINHVANTEVAFTFDLPVAFPTGCLTAWASPVSGLAGSPSMCVSDLSKPTQVSGTAYSTDAITRDYRIHIIGY